jgi:hypothetical protein
MQEDKMSSFNESSVSIKYYFEVEWGVPKKIYLDKFSFGDEFFYVLELNGERQFVKNPVFIYPEQSIKNVEYNPLIEILEEFYYNNSLFPRCSIGAEVIEGKQIKKITVYRFHTVKILERYGGGGDRRVNFYKIRFDNWSKG